MGMFKEFWEEEDGIATVEILLILAVLIIIAIIFRNAIIKWVKNILANLFVNYTAVLGEMEGKGEGMGQELKWNRKGIITVEAALVIPVIVGVIVMLYCLAMIEYQNVCARTQAMRTANRAAMNWKTIGAQYTVFDEDLKDTVFLEDTLSNGGKTGKNVITSESYANHEPYRFFTELFAPVIRNRKICRITWKTGWTKLEISLLPSIWK